MKDSDDFETPASQPVWNHEGRASNHELSSTRHAARAAKIRQLGQPFDSGQKRRRNPACGTGVLLRDVRPKLSEVGDRAGGPDDDHARGAFRSFFRPHE